MDLDNLKSNGLLNVITLVLLLNMVSISGKLFIKISWSF